MNTVNATPVALDPAQKEFSAPRPAAPRAAPPGTEVIARGVFDGLHWTYRDGFDATLARVPAAVWSHPGDQPWRHVKHNGARDVWRAEIAGQVFYVKYYRYRRWPGSLLSALRGQACRIEWSGGLYALRAGIPAVRPLACADRVAVDGRACAVLVTESLEPAYPLNEIWLAVLSDADRARSRGDRLHLIDVVAKTIARAHQSGFEHLDMHAANILVQPVAPRRYRAAFVDLQSARLGMPISDRAVVRNLAQLNQWFRRHSTLADRLRFLRAYVRWRHEFEHQCEHARRMETPFEELFGALVRAADRHADRLWAQRDRRVRRDGRYFARVRARGWQGMAAVRSKHAQPESPASSMVLGRDWWKARLSDPLRWFLSADALCKNSHSASVARAALPIEGGELPVIIKRPLARNWRRSLRLLLPPHRSARGWTMGYALLNRDIPAARPLAFLERRRAGLVLDSLLITEVVPDSVDLDRWIREEHERCPPRTWRRRKREMSELLMRHVRALHDRNFDHRDCKAQNILVVRRPQLRLVWIDMDGLRRRRDLPPAARLRALTRLHVSLIDAPGVTRADRARFLKSYFARYGADVHAWRDAWRRIATEAARKLSAREVRRRWKLKHYGRE